MSRLILPRSSVCLSVLKSCPLCRPYLKTFKISSSKYQATFDERQIARTITLGYKCFKLIPFELCKWQFFKQYKKSYCSHPGRPRPRPCPRSRPHSRHTATKFYMQVFQKFRFRQPLVRKHSYLGYRYTGGPTFIP